MYSSTTEIISFLILKTETCIWDPLVQFSHRLSQSQQRISSCSTRPVQASVWRHCQLANWRVMMILRRTLYQRGQDLPAALDKMLSRRLLLQRTAGKFQSSQWQLHQLSRLFQTPPQTLITNIGLFSRCLVCHVSLVLSCLLALSAFQCHAFNKLSNIKLLIVRYLWPVWTRLMFSTECWDWFTQVEIWLQILSFEKWLLSTHLQLGD